VSEPLAPTSVEPAAGGAADPLDAMAAMRTRGMQPFDHVGLYFIDALARRAAGHEGEVRRVLDARLARARAERGERQAGAAILPADTPATRQEAPAAGGPLADLLRHMARHSADGQAGAPAGDVPTDGVRPAELKALSRFRSTWSRLSLDRQLSRSLTKAPENAGPLNSHHLALRSLISMRDIAPDYLSRFMSFIDALQWLDQAAAGGTPSRAGAAGVEADQRRKPRGRRPA
jgi:Protein of unknown function (DUF2894)